VTEEVLMNTEENSLLLPGMVGKQMRLACE
jgi:hypothetical protein